MITKIRLQNWKSFKDSTIYIDSLGILIGTNASGKSNVLDAFAFLRAVGEGKSLLDAIQTVRGGEDWIIRRGEDFFCIEIEIEIEGSYYLLDLRVIKRNSDFSFGPCEIHRLGIEGDDVSLGSDGDLLIVGVPSYAGKVPEMAVRSLRRFLGNNTPAIIVSVYGNRAYDDTLIELKDLMESHGFKFLSAAAVIAQHSIFPKIAEGRPNADDMEKLHEFASKSRELLIQIPKMSAVSRLMVKGNRPYRDTKPIPLHPEGSKGKCISCHACVKMCPVGAITMKEPYKTNEKKCISCGRCVVVCPEHG